MRLYHYSMLFMILFLGIASMLYAKQQATSRREKERQMVERSVDLATDAAAGYLATYSDGRLQIEKEEVLEIFFYNLFASLGVLDRIYEQEHLKACVTCVVILDRDGYYLWRERCGKEEGGEDGGEGREDGKEEIKEGEKEETTKDEEGKITEDEKGETTENEDGRAIENEIANEGGKSEDKSEEAKEKGRYYGWDEKVFFTANVSREEMIEKAVLLAIRQQKEARGFAGEEYRLELPNGEGMLKRELGEYGVLVMLRGIPERGREKTYEHFAFSGAALYKINP